MNDKELIKSWTVDLTDYQRDMLEDMMQKARQDEREKLEAENASLKKEVVELKIQNGEYLFIAQNRYAEILEHEARWDSLKTVIRNMIKVRENARKNNDIYRLSACELNDDFIDMLEKLINELEKEKEHEL